MAVASVTAASESGSISLLEQLLFGLQGLLFWPFPILGGLCALIAGYGALILAEQNLVNRSADTDHLLD